MSCLTWQVYQLYSFLRRYLYDMDLTSFRYLEISATAVHRFEVHHAGPDNRLAVRKYGKVPREDPSVLNKSNHNFVAITFAR